MGATIVIRTDASRWMGTGHVVRCLTLADALRARSATVHFVCRLHEGHLCDEIERRGFTVSQLMSSTEHFRADDSLAHADWLGARWEDDATDTIAAIDAQKINPDWLVVDHYAIDARWEERLRPFVRRIIAIDDIADRNHDCDVLIDQNFVADISARYRGRIPDHCTAFLGPRHALLQPIYAELRDQARSAREGVQRIFVFFGGADTHNVTLLVLQAFLSLNRPDVHLDVVMRGGSNNDSSIRSLANGHSNIGLHYDLPCLAPLMAKADLAIGACGATSWERLCLGLPSLVTVLAENQRPIACELVRRDLVRLLGDGELTLTALQRQLAELIGQGLEEWSRRCAEVVDGRGLLRVTTAMLLDAASSLRARRAAPADEMLLLEWANDPQTRRNAFSWKPITAQEHHNWFTERLRDENGCRLYIVESEEGVPVGQVRFQKRDGVLWEIHYSLGKCFRGRGISGNLLRSALSAMTSDICCMEVLARVKWDNAASRKALARVGFGQERVAGDVHILKLSLRR